MCVTPGVLRLHSRYRVMYLTVFITFIHYEYRIRCTLFTRVLR